MCNIQGAECGKLSGMRVAVKDTVAVAGVPMRGGSNILEGYVPEFDATITTRILDAGNSSLFQDVPTNCKQTNEECTSYSQLVRGSNQTFHNVYARSY